MPNQILNGQRLYWPLTDILEERVRDLAQKACVLCRLKMPDETQGCKARVRMLVHIAASRVTKRADVSCEILQQHRSSSHGPILPEIKFKWE